jgi:4-hydroxy-tetrahydrodipicolinate synthase
MSDPLFRGAITALATPFRDGAIDWPALERLLERQVEAGIHGVVPVGTTGETATLSPEEHKRVVSFCVETIAGRIPVIAGAGSNSTAEAIDLVRHAEAAGAQGALVVTPYYNRPSQEGLRRHYTAIAEACGLPVVIYNVPSRTGSDIATETVLRLCELPTIAGVKDATGDLARVSLMRVKAREDFALLSGDDPSALGYVAQGGHGVISVTSNVAPHACARWMDAAVAGRFAEALEWQDRLIALHKALFLDSSPAPTKFALAELGLCTEEVRLPIAPCAEAARPVIREAMAAAGL